MPRARLPQPPKDVVVDATGRLTPQFHRWLEQFFQKVGGSGPIPTESISPKAVLNATNDAKVDWVDTNASVGLVRAYGPGGVGSDWNRYEGTVDGYQTIGPFPASSFVRPYGFIYYVAYDPATGTFLCTTDFRETLKEGLYSVGTTRANASFGGSGATAGGGGTANPPAGGTSGVGGSVDDPTIGYKSGLGVLG